MSPRGFTRTCRECNINSGASERAFRVVGSDAHVGRGCGNSTLYYTEKDKYLRFGFPFGERDPRNEDFQALIRRLWKFVGECPSAQSIINIPVYPPFFDYGMVFARVKELTHPGMMFGSAGATVGLRDYFPALETLRIRMCPSSPDAKEWKVKDVVDVSGVNEVIVEPVVFEEEGLFLDEFEPWPFHSKTGTKLIFAFPKGDLLVMHHDLVSCP